jgi:hypothetical protein
MWTIQNATNNCNIILAVLACGQPEEQVMTTEAHLAATIPPTVDEWVWMADSHLRVLLAAYVVANGSPSTVTRVPAREMGDVVTELGLAAEFHRSFAELCETAERRLINVAIGVA